MILGAAAGTSSNVLGKTVIHTALFGDSRMRSLSGNIELSGLCSNHGGDFDTADVEENEGDETTV